MSDNARPEREWRSFVEDMIKSGESALTFIAGMDVNEFLNDERTYKATLWDLRIIGEAASNVPRFVQDNNPHISWAEIIAMRNRITHSYGAIDIDIVWDTLQNDVPIMIADLRELLQSIDESTA